MLTLLSDMTSELNVINDRLAAIDAEIKALARTYADTQRPMEIPGVGATIVTALLALFAPAAVLTKGGDLAAWLGLAARPS